MKENHHKAHKGRQWPASGRILAVDPGTRYMGIAILRSQELIRADVENVREGGMRRGDVIKKARAILERCIRLYEPEILAIEQPFFAQSKRSRTLQKLVESITALGREKGIAVRRYSPMAVRRFICKAERPTRLSTAEVIATEYFPWLAPYYEKEVQRSWWRQRYWTTMFDAIAVGLACTENMDPKNTRRKAA